MNDKNKAILKKANAAILTGDHEGFLAHCHEDIAWGTVGEESIQGKAAVRQWMRENYVKPPRFEVDEMVAEDDTVVAIGTIDVEVNGISVKHAYSDVWRFREGTMVALRAFVIPLC